MANLTPITNDIDLIRIVTADMGDVLDDLADWLVKKIVEEIQDKVYDVPQPEDSPYQRLGLKGGFIGAWEADASEIIGNCVTNFIRMHPELLQWHGENLQHGNKEVDRTRYMDSLIAEGSGWDIGGNAMMSRDYWSDVARLVESGEIDSILERFFISHGIAFRRGI